MQAGEQPAETAKAMTPRCHIPWQQMVIDSTGATVPCCYWGAYENDNAPVGNINTQTMEEIWNGPGFQKLRAGMAKGDLVAAGCSNCYAIKQGLGLAFEYDPACEREAGPRTAYASNIDTLRREIATGATVLQAKPTIVSFTPSHRCNIRCTHCYQEGTRNSEISRQRAEDEVVAFAPYLVRLVASGGEPFLLPIWNKFLSKFDLKDNPYLDFATSTNATIVSDKIIDGLKRFKKLTINVSLDGTGAVYDSVRVGAKFDKVVENIRKLRMVVGAAESTQSAIGVSMCVMKSNVLDLPNFVRFNTEEGLAFGLSPVITLPPNESLRCFNDYWQETRGWNEAIDEAERLVQDVYLPAMVKRRNENVVQQSERDFWTQNFSLLRAAVKSDAAAEQAYRVTVIIPEFLQQYSDIKPRSAQIAYFFVAGMPGPPSYWAPVVDGKAEVSLPAGEYTVNINTKWTPAIYHDLVLCKVAAHSDQTVECVSGFLQGRGLEMSIADTASPLPSEAKTYLPPSGPMLRRIVLPDALFRQLPFLETAGATPHAILYRLGRPEQTWLTKAPVIGRSVQFALPPGSYCLSFSATPVSPGYWDVVRFGITSESGREIHTTYHPITAHRIYDSTRRRLRHLLGAVPPDPRP